MSDAVKLIQKYEHDFIDLFNNQKYSEIPNVKLDFSLLNPEDCNHNYLKKEILRQMHSADVNVINNRIIDPIHWDPKHVYKLQGLNHIVNNPDSFISKEDKALFSPEFNNLKIQEKIDLLKNEIPSDFKEYLNRHKKIFERFEELKTGQVEINSDLERIVKKTRVETYTDNDNTRHSSEKADRFEDMLYCIIVKHDKDTKLLAEYGSGTFDTTINEIHRPSSESRLRKATDFFVDLLNIDYHLQKIGPLRRNQESRWYWVNKKLSSLEENTAFKIAYSVDRLEKNGFLDKY